MAIDKKITDLTAVSEVYGNDVSIIARNGTDYQYNFANLLQYIQQNSVNGATISFGTNLPQNNIGKNGDLFLNTAANNFAQKVNGSWIIQYQINTGGSGNSVLYNLGAPQANLGTENDTYINTANGIFYKKINGSWNQVFSMQTGPSGPPGPKGDTGANGIDGNSLLNGEGDPSNITLGKDGDFYLNTVSWKIFGPKKGGNWGNGVLLDIDTSAFATVSDLQTKVDKVLGKQLTDVNFSAEDKIKLDKLIDRYKGKYLSLASLQQTVTDASAGDYAIVTGNPDDQEYIWDSDNHTWVLTQDVPASTFGQLGGSPTDNIALSSLITNINTGINNNTTDISLVKAALVIHPVYKIPAAVLSSPQAGNKYEVGSQVSVTLDLSYQQNDGGPASGFAINKNSSNAANQNSFSESIIMGISPISYQGVIAYNTGPVKANNFGDTDPTGQIQSGNISSNTISFQGYYAMRYGSVTTAINTSDSIRSLQGQLTITGNTFTINTGSTNKIFQFWIPSTKTLISVIDQDALNANITSSYAVSDLQVNDAGQNPVPGKLYTMTNAIPYSSNHRHLITVN
ncbi:hypothetical protein [Mucilaginibacter sp. KACC 22063]|uniref:hypothetical protein n=1 Tax=Mucilaginibacter sp. KACC 22063 TaxID=3025666 RepID=UPI002366FB5B|nr:hypothetical protein [Mucilaginibacter sp. KACC 22063]WDF54664.1 hypothetical protein PQ461_17160 [Mucilaginibacter sp. KACC 22063]